MGGSEASLQLKPQTQEDFEQRVKPLVVNKTVVHATAIPLNLPSECKRAPKHAIEFEDDETCPDACPLLAEAGLLLRKLI